MIRDLLPIRYAGREFKVLEYTGDLWRGDRESFQVGSLASQNYRGAEIKYFATQHHEVESYAQLRGMPHVKQWRVTKPLVLINMFDPSTRANVLAMLREQQANDNTIRGNLAAINMAFPVARNGSVFRVSTADTAKIGDDIFLKALCRLFPFAHGYYSPAQESSNNRGVPWFHSEVGLCQRGFQLLKLEDVNREGPPPAPNNNARRRTARNRRNRNRNRNRSRSRNRFAAAAPAQRLEMLNAANNIGPAAAAAAAAQPPQARRGIFNAFNNNNAGLVMPAAAAAAAQPQQARRGIFNALNNNNAGLVMPAAAAVAQPQARRGIFNAFNNNNAGLVMPAAAVAQQPQAHRRMFNGLNNDNAGFVMPPTIGRRFTLNNNNDD